MKTSHFQWNTCCEFDFDHRLAAFVMCVRTSGSLLGCECGCIFFICEWGQTFVSASFNHLYVIISNTMKQR